MLDAFQKLFLQKLPGEPTKDQEALLEKLSHFLLFQAERKCFVLRGYAGTGKTTAVGAIVNSISKYQLQSVLLAPTGRAAKIMAKFAKRPAFTIHKYIYQKKRIAHGQVRFELAHNRNQNTIFLVDEASMISDGQGLNQTSSYKANSLLADLISYVYSSYNCAIIFIGDIAQLPPVGSDFSPALEPRYLRDQFNLKLFGAELKEVLRQVADSGILFNATKIRNQIVNDEFNIRIEESKHQDVHWINGMELEESLEKAVADYGTEEVVVITRSNKRANEFNQQFRVRILDLDEELATGDYLMVVKNNYFWLGHEDAIGFIANGDIGEISAIENHEEIYGFHFSNLQLRLIDYPDTPSISVKVLKETLHTNYSALSPEESNSFFDKVMEDYEDEPSRKKKFEMLKKNPHYNALQVKFAHALTCHKAQGGQWRHVFIDQGYLTEEMLDKDYMRWLYTAITRAKTELSFVNFHPDFLVD